MGLSEVIRPVVVNAVTGTQHSQLVPKDSVIFVPAPHPGTHSCSFSSQIRPDLELGNKPLWCSALSLL